jgi:hypothetical protein
VLRFTGHWLSLLRIDRVQCRGGSWDHAPVLTLPAVVWPLSRSLIVVEIDDPRKSLVYLLSSRHGFIQLSDIGIGFTTLRFYFGNECLVGGSLRCLTFHLGEGSSRELGDWPAADVLHELIESTVGLAGCLNLLLQSLVCMVNDW